LTYKAAQAAVQKQQLQRQIQELQALVGAEQQRRRREEPVTAGIAELSLMDP
jgi:hypothetical protein